MSKVKKHFYIDKFTECIEEVSTGQIFETEVLPVTKKDLKNVLKKNGWNFSLEELFENARKNGL